MAVKKFLWSVLVLAGLISVIVGIVQFVMAMKYGELGRVVMYFALALFGAALAAAGIVQLVRLRK